MNFRYIYRAELNPDSALASAFEKSSNPKQRDTRLIVDSMTLPPKFRIGLNRPGSWQASSVSKMARRSGNFIPVPFERPPPLRQLLKVIGVG